MRKLFILLSFLVLTSCKDTLDKITNASELLKECKISQKYPDDCTQKEKQLEILITTATKEGLESKRIYAAKNLGELNIEGNEEESLYKILTDNLNKEIANYPLRIPLENSNYEAYWQYCYKYKAEKIEKDDDSAEQLRKITLIINEISRIDKYVIKLGHIVKNNQLHAIFMPFTGCIPKIKQDKRSAAIKNIALIFKEQLLNLKNGRYISDNNDYIENKWNNKKYKFEKITAYLVADFDEGEKIFNIINSDISNPNLRTEADNLLINLAKDNFLKNFEDKTN